jgi:hypothetical protein
MLSNDHLLNWPINNISDYTVGIGEEHVGPADVIGYAPTLAWRTGTGMVAWPCSR